MAPHGAELGVEVELQSDLVELKSQESNAGAHGGPRFNRTLWN